MSDTAYIYGLTDPRDDAIRYVGLTRNITQRIASHIQYSVELRGLKDSWIQELIADGILPGFRILECVGWSDGGRKERQWIRALRKEGCLLFNLSHGGQQGKLHRPPVRRKQKATAKELERIEVLRIEEETRTRWRNQS